MIHKNLSLIISTLLFFLTPFIAAICQDGDSSQARHLYRPANTLDSPPDTIPVVREETGSLSQEQTDSLTAREKFVQDSIAARQQFVRDSIIAREIFVRDSIARRRRILDSLQFLQAELPVLLKASTRILDEKMIISDTPLQIDFDSVLSDYTYTSLIFGFNKPYKPWRETLKLSEGKLKITVDTIAKKIKSIKAPGFYHFYDYDKKQRTVRVESKSILVSMNNIKYFRSPVDSVFFNAKRQVVKVKQYHLFYQATQSLQRGKLKYTDLVVVKQFKYSTNGDLSQVKQIKICGRNNLDRNQGEVCNIITYDIINQNKVYTVVRSTDPKNAYADGTFVYEYVDDYRLKSVSFVNLNKTENRKTYIEVNEHGNVSRYVYENNGKISQTLLVKYNSNPRAKHKVETISCSFEDDGISYFQVNNTTNKKRTRDKLTMEWSDWK